MLYFLPFSRSELHRLVERELELWRERVSDTYIDDVAYDKDYVYIAPTT